MLRVLRSLHHLVQSMCALLTLLVIAPVGNGLVDRLDREIVVLRSPLRRAGLGTDGETVQYCGTEMPPLDP